MEEWLLHLLRHEIIPSKGTASTLHDIINPSSVFCGSKVEAPWRKLTVRVIHKPDDGTLLR